MRATLTRAFSGTTAPPFRRALPALHENPLGLPRFRAPPSTGLPHKDDVPRFQRGLPTKQRIPNVTKVLAITSGKGGVGKSTLAANLALSFSSHLSLRVGLLDADVFGPSVPKIFNLQDAGEPRLDDAGRLLPLTNYGVKTMSMGYLVGAEKPVVWRGLMVMKAMQQLLLEVEWGGLDLLVVDMPPGTGDVQLSLCQLVEVDGAVVVSTPQDVALVDAVKGVNMFRKVDIPIVGMVQNMSMFTCPHCSHSTHIFGADGVNRECAKHDVPFLGDVPLDAEICADADRGRPTVVARVGPLTDAYRQVAEKVYKSLFGRDHVGGGTV